MLGAAACAATPGVLPPLRLPPPPILTRLATPDTRGSGASVHLLPLSLSLSALRYSLSLSPKPYRTLPLLCFYACYFDTEYTPYIIRVCVHFHRDVKKGKFNFQTLEMEILSGGVFWLERKFNSISPLPNCGLLSRSGGWIAPSH